MCEPPLSCVARGKFASAIAFRKRELEIGVPSGVVIGSR